MRSVLANNPKAWHTTEACSQKEGTECSRKADKDKRHRESLGPWLDSRAAKVSMSKKMPEEVDVTEEEEDDMKEAKAPIQKAPVKGKKLQRQRRKLENKQHKKRNLRLRPGWEPSNICRKCEKAS